MNKVSVIISAYNASDYIEECLNSVNNQTYFTSNDFEILLGIDNCQETLDKVMLIKDNYENLKVWWFEENLGPYIVFNTLIKMSTGTIISIFGADDVMIKDFMEKNIPYLNEKTYVIAKGVNFTNVINKNIKGGYNPHGIILVHKSNFMKLNGFADWRCGADSDLNIRLLSNKIRMINSPVITYYRRIHDKQLTKHKLYGFSNPYRIQVGGFIKKRKAAKLIVNEKYITYDNIKQIK